MDDWENIREQFTEEEKTLLNKAICGQVICPRGVTLDEAMLGTLASKVKSAVHQSRVTSHQARNVSA